MVSIGRLDEDVYELRQVRLRAISKIKICGDGKIRPVFDQLKNGGSLLIGMAETYSILLHARSSAIFTALVSYPLTLLLSFSKRDG
jgi:hypothetical protein